ncbi:DUF4260 domain-containing protein [Rhodopseudomonas palustris]|uniref:DUF4260 domain-containing protein n=1 Tax=Rhodopseudomonas palustris (strain ATCC BAA-98 / CGA009) TaxID=258594 RepID=Q6N4X9_RHOPA|nr:DUF4260 domain-containing protein [Rhodopseudomonas palustris]OPF93782.1 hypothetical protein B1S06_11440 [Rhodopseudomonas palustris]PPQ44291.1 DUF4260 domain-containing protein [Rhodopseudomonas palustris]QQM04737.1 hypothetical protein I8G32_03298 [Rhodopseudomonas palustris]RJF66314.1 DUF4260 family protein [Rhodopseudomonas palustris]WAB76111.1 DUF4260 domain-containing protein [Rhodopseudomonas palustris]
MTAALPSADPSVASGGILTVLRAEGLALFAGCTLFYVISDAPWELYALLFFAPDLGFLGYLAGSKVGAVVYNTLHSTIGPLLLAIAGIVLVVPYAGTVAMIWLAHIGFDRALGYGLKYKTGFRVTHLGPIGKAPAGHY